MGKYRKKPVVIEAEQFHSKDKPLPFANKKAVSFDGEGFYVETMHKNQKVYLEDGDWVIPEPNGKNFYPCKPDIFEKTYEAVE